MRWLGGLSLVLASACSFTPRLAGDDAPAPDASGATDGAPDGTSSVAGHVRRLAVGDDKVTGGPHAAFPALVALTAPWLRATDEGGDVADEDGADLHFTADAEGAVPLAFEIEAYDDESGALVAWVQVPSLAQGTAIYLRYGDPARDESTADAAAVWAADHAGVWHLTGSAIVDATGRSQATNSGTSAGDGHIARARSFSNGNSISVPAVAAQGNVFAGGGTAEAWFFATGWGQSGFGRIFDKSAFVMGMGEGSVDGSVLFGHAFSGSPGNWTTPEDSIALNAWTHVAVVYDQSSSANVPAIYVNGVARTVTATTNPAGVSTSDAASSLIVGNRVTNDRAFAGRLDELRLSSVARSAAWIATTYANARDPSAFWTVTP